MNILLVFSQNAKIESIIEKLKVEIKKEDNVSCITSHSLFDYEEKMLKEAFSCSKFVSFSDILSDKDNDSCDIIAYQKNVKDCGDYYDNIKDIKNELIIKRISEKYNYDRGYILSDDLGFRKKIWTRNGFISLEVEQYYSIGNAQVIKNTIMGILYRVSILVTIYRRYINNKEENIYVAYHKGIKYIFVGKMDRIRYRLDIEFKQDENEKIKYNQGKFETKEKCVYLSTLHEAGKLHIPDSEKYSVKIIQDGFLPQNYSSLYLKFKNKNVSYYAWDEIGTRIFKKQNLPVEILPFRKCIMLNNPKFPSKLCNILVVASGSGDWTAQKNRSDDDYLVKAFILIAKNNPHINVVYRCHPTWTHPNHVGVNSIKRVQRCLLEANVPNMKISGNIPDNSLDNYTLTFSRNSLNEDLKNSDIVFGEHSISMIDAAMQGILFCSVNVTQRRNLFDSISDMGFPHCESVSEIQNVIDSIGTQEFKIKYEKAIIEYNKMTERECDEV